MDITSFAIGSGSARLLVVCLDYYTNPGTTTVTFNGVACTRAQAYSAGDNYAEIWYMTNPPSGSYTIHHTQTTATEIIMGAWSYTGVDQNSPIGAINTGTGTSKTASVSITSTVPNSYIVDTTSNMDNSQTVGSGQTQRYNINTLTNMIGAGSDRATTTVGSYTMSWSLQTKAQWADIAVEIKPAPAPEFPFGPLILAIPVVAVFLYLRRRLGPPTMSKA